MGYAHVWKYMSAKRNRRGIISKALGESPPYATTFEVDLYALGFDVPLNKRFAAVDVKRDQKDEIPSVSVRGPTGRWTVSEEKTVLYRHGRTPEWLRTVLEYAGVDEILEGR